MPTDTIPVDFDKFVQTYAGRTTKSGRSLWVGWVRRGAGPWEPVLSAKSPREAASQLVKRFTGPGVRHGVFASNCTPAGPWRDDSI